MAAPFPTIGFDARLWHRTGIGSYIRNLTARLRGVDLVVWALLQDVDVVQADLPTAVVRACPARPFGLGETLFWRRELHRVPLDVFHAPHVNIPIGVPVPIVVTVHDLIPLRCQGTINWWLTQRYFRIMSELAISQAARVVVVSETTRRDLVNLLRTNPAKIRTVGEDPAAAETLAIYHEVLGETAPPRASANPAPLWHLWGKARTPRSSFGTGN